MSLKERFERNPIPFERMAAIGKVLIFLALVLAEIILAVDCRNTEVEGIPALLVILPVSAALAAENAVKLFALRSFKRRIVCYVTDILLLLVLTYFSGGRLISTLFVVILSEFYLSQEKLSGNIAMGVCSAVLYLAMLAVSQMLRDEPVALDVLISNAFEDLIIFVLHFLIMNFLLLIYRKNEEIAKRVKELDESNRKLGESNKKLAEAMEKLNSASPKISTIRRGIPSRRSSCRRRRQNLPSSAIPKGQNAPSWLPICRQSTPSRNCARACISFRAAARR